ncbi:unnamed protein product [Orchesella dallaii]|uniref:BTB domain-containing protein n=1 Tax=Orchesella dallaii TaxID=48710 RepID=A0ABP1QH83_9HEXA
MASNSPRKKVTEKFQRPPGLEAMFYTDVLQSQQTDANGNLADTLLICSGGTIRAHAFLLQAASPFIQYAIQSQGENYPFMREILLPDFSVKEIERMLTLVYKGTVDLKNTKEIQSLRETLKFFQITSILVTNEKNDSTIKGSLKIQELNRIPKDIFKVEAKEKSINGNSTAAHVEILKVSEDGGVGEKRRKMVASAPGAVTEGVNDSVSRNGTKYNSTRKRGKVSESDGSGVEILSGDEASDDNLPRRGRRKNQLKTLTSLQPVLKLHRHLPQTTVSPSPSVTSSTTVALQNSEHEKEDSETDEEDIGWVAPAYKDKLWFSKESRRCQHCNKKFEKPASASLCITSHKSLRCYFCFKVYSTTDILFKHFRRRHKQAGRESSLICPFCEVTVPYKSVSCHVISAHLKNKTESEEPNTGGRPSSSIKSKSIASNNGVKSRSRHSSSPDRSPLKKPKNNEGGKTSRQMTLTEMQKSKDTEQLTRFKVPDLDITIEKETSLGKKLVFRLEKKRSTITNNAFK